MDGGHLSRDFCWKILAILEQEDRVKKKKKRRPSQVEWGKIPERSSCDENKMCPSTEAGVDTIVPGRQSWDEIIEPAGHIHLV